MGPRGLPVKGRRRLLGKTSLYGLSDQLQKRFRRRHCLGRFRIADQSDVVKGIVSLPAHAVEQGKCRGQLWIKVFLRKFDDGNMVAELNSWPLTVTQHQRQRTLEHRFIGDLVGGFRINPEVLPSRVCLFFCVCQELSYLLWIDFLWLGLAHLQLAQFVCRPRCLTQMHCGLSIWFSAR